MWSTQAVSHGLGGGIYLDDTKVYPTEDKAKEIAEKLAETSSWQVFYRPYIYESHRPQKLPEHTGGCPQTLVGTPKPMIYCEVCRNYKPHNHMETEHSSPVLLSAGEQ